MLDHPPASKGATVSVSCNEGPGLYFSLLAHSSTEIWRSKVCSNIPPVQRPTGSVGCKQGLFVKPPLVTPKKTLFQAFCS